MLFQIVPRGLGALPPSQVHEAVNVRAFASEGSVEAVHEGIVGWFALSREVNKPFHDSKH